jgi:hypothetical protein
VRAYWRTALIGMAALGLPWTFSPAEPAEEGYAPVSPPGAVHAALQSSLKAVQDWLGGKDFASAAREVQGLTALAHLYACQGRDPAWRDKTAALIDASSRLGTAAGKEDAAGCERLVEECARLLEDLARRSPGARAADNGFKPPGSTRTWMLLLDSAFTDAKWAKNAGELEGFARTVAEEANVVQYLRSGPRWRQSAREVRTAALEMAARAKANDFAAARAVLKTISRQCQACHEQTNRR